MTARRDIRGEMRNLLLDRATADRLLTGHVDPDDAPPGYAGVAEVLRSASSFPLLDPEREQATVAAMVEEIRTHLLAPSPDRQRRSIKRLVRAKVMVLAVGATLVGTTSLAFAGALPGAAQAVAHTMLARIGVSVPGPARPVTMDPGADGIIVPRPPTLTSSPHPSVEPSPTGSHGQSGQPHGQSGQPHGQSGQPHGQSGQPHGQSGQPHGQSGQPHGQSGQPHGQSGQPHGGNDSSSPSEGSTS